MLREDKRVASGMSGEDARYAARRAFGGIEHARERQRDLRPFRTLDSWWLAVKLVLLMLIKQPGLAPIRGFSIVYGAFLVSSLAVEGGRCALSILALLVALTTTGVTVLDLRYLPQRRAAIEQEVRTKAAQAGISAPIRPYDGSACGCDVENGGCSLWSAGPDG